MIIFDNLTIPLMVFTDYRMWAGELIFWILNLPVRLFFALLFWPWTDVGQMLCSAGGAASHGDDI